MNPNYVILAQLILNLRFGEELEDDGIFGKFSTEASQRALPWEQQGFKGQPSPTRRVAAIIQHEAGLRGIEAGPYDGFWGRLTEKAASQLIPIIFPKQPQPEEKPCEKKINIGSIDIVDTNLKFRKSRTPLRNPTHLVIHHTANPNKAWAIKECHAWHNQIGWNGIGYNYIIDASTNTPYYGRSTSDQEFVGSHVSGWNSRSIGVCLTGHYSTEPPSAKGVEVTAQLAANLMRKYKIPLQNLKRHNDLATKDCPGRLFPWEQFTKMVKELL